MNNSEDSLFVEGYGDLWKRNGVILPSGFYCTETPVLLAGCTTSAFSLTLFARLLDRKTHQVIAQESESMRFIAAK